MRGFKKKIKCKKKSEMKPKVTETQERTVTTDNSVRNARSKGGILEIPTERQKGLK